MSKSLKIYLLAFIALIVLVIFIDSNRKKPVNWSPSFQLDDKIPFGLYVFDQEINSILGKSITRCNTTFYEYFYNSDTTQVANTTFLAINKDVRFDTESENLLLRAVSKGSCLFISSEGFKNSLLDSLKVKESYTYLRPEFVKADSLNLTLSNPLWSKETFPLSPNVSEYRFSDMDVKTTTVLGYIHYPDDKKYINFIRVKYGKGTVYLMNQPMVFTNYSLLSKNNIGSYAENVLSYLPKDKSVVWFTDGQSVHANDNKTSLSVMFRYPALRYTWLLFLYGILGFIFFNVKRRQRVVPVIKPLRNTTVEFTQTIGNLYYQEGTVSDMIEKKIIYFLDKVRNRYYLDTRTMDDEFVRKLHIKSGKDLSLVKDIVNFIIVFNRLKRSDEDSLIELNDLIERFFDQQ